MRILPTDPWVVEDDVEDAEEETYVPEKYNRVAWKTKLIGVPINGKEITVEKGHISYLTDGELDWVRASNGCDNDSSVFISERVVCADCMFDMSRTRWYGHAKLHSQEGDNECPKCKIKFPTERGLREHYKSCRGKSRVNIRRG